MKRLIPGTLYYLKAFIHLFENRKAGALLLVWAAVAATAQAQTPGVTANGNTEPACPGEEGVLRLHATCDVAPIRVVVNDQEGRPIFSGEFPTTDKDDISMQANGGLYYVRLSCNSADKGTYNFQLGSPPPVVTIGKSGSAGTVSTVCNAADLTLTLSGTAPAADGTSVQWIGPGTISNAASPNATVTNVPAGRHTYRYIWKKAGCSDVTVTGVVTVVEVPQLKPQSAIETCDGADTGTIIFSNTNNVQNVTYYWSNNRPGIGLGASGTGNIPSFAPVNTASGPLSAVITVRGTTNGCSSNPMNFDIKVYPRPQATLAADKINYCAGENIVLTVTANLSGKYTFTGPNNFQYPRTADPPIENTNKTATVLNSVIASAGTYTVKVSIGSTGNCEREATTSVNVRQGPDLRITDIVACNNTRPADLTALGVTDGSRGTNIHLTYWHDSQATTQLNRPDQVRTAGTYYIKADDGFCSVTKPVSVAFRTDAPELEVSDPAPVCEGAASGFPVDLSATITHRHNARIITYWKDPATTVSVTPDANNNNKPMVTEPGNITYYIKVENGPCFVVKPVVVVINARPVVRVHTPAVICGSPDAIEQVNICDPPLTAGTGPIDEITHTDYPYTFWLDAAATQSAGTPSQSATDNTRSLKLPASEHQAGPDRTAGKREYLYYIRAQKKYGGAAPANVCYSIPTQIKITFGVTPVVRLENLDKSTKTSLCDNEKRDLGDFARSEPAGASFSYYTNSTATAQVSNPRSVGEGTYYIKATSSASAGGCSSSISPSPPQVKLIKFAKPILVTKNFSTCYVSNMEDYDLYPLVESFNGDANTLFFSNTDAYQAFYRNGSIKLPANKTEANPGVTLQPIWIQGTKTYTYEYRDNNTPNPTVYGNQTRACFSDRQSPKFTVKPLPSVYMPNGPKDPVPANRINSPAHHELLCSDGKTNLTPGDLNFNAYPEAFAGNGWTKTAAYYWTAKECGRDGAPNEGQNIISGELSQQPPPIPPATSPPGGTAAFPPIVQTLKYTGGSAPGVGYVNYQFTAILNGCRGMLTDYIIVPVCDTPSPLVHDTRLEMCSGTVYNPDGSENGTGNPPAKCPVLLATVGGEANIFFNWKSQAIANGAGNKATGNTNYLSIPGSIQSQAQSGGGGDNLGAGVIGDYDGRTDLNISGGPLVNNTDEDEVVEYQVLPYKVAAIPNDDGQGAATGYCMGVWGRATVTVHPVPKLETSAFAPSGRVIICDNSRLGINLVTDKKGSKYYWESAAPIDEAKVNGFQETKAPNPPQESAVFRDQILDNLTTGVQQFDIRIIPNTAYSNGFSGCNGRPVTVGVTLREHEAPVISYIFNTLSTNEGVEAPAICANVPENVHIPLSCSVEGLTNRDESEHLQSRIKYSWTIGGEYLLDGYLPNAPWKYYGDTFAPNPIPSTQFSGGGTALRATIKLAPGTNGGEEQFHTQSHDIYYDITPEYNGCFGTSRRVDITVNPDPLITEITPPFDVACNGEQTSFELKSHYADGEMIYNWYVPQNNEKVRDTETLPPPSDYDRTDKKRCCKGAADTETVTGNPNNFNNPRLPENPRSPNDYIDPNDPNAVTKPENRYGAWQSSPVSGKFVFPDKEAKTITVVFTPKNRTTGCFGPVKTAAVSVFPKPDAQATGAPAAVCMGESSILNLISPKGVENVGFRWEPSYDRAILQPSTNYTAPPPMADRPPSPGPVIDRWNVADGKSVTEISRISYMIVPFIGRCHGDTIHSEVVIYPKPTMVVTMDHDFTNGKGVCSGTPITINLRTARSMQDVKFRWRAEFNTETITGMSSNSLPSDGPISQTIFNNGRSQDGGLEYRITPVLSYPDDPNLPDSRGECLGDAVTKNITVNPIPDLQVAKVANSPEVICSSGTVDIELKCTNLAAEIPLKYKWTVTPRDPTRGVSGQAVGEKTSAAAPQGSSDAVRATESIRFGPLENHGTSEQSITYVAQAEAAFGNDNPPFTCKGEEKYLTVKVAPQPKMLQPTAPAVCSGDKLYIALQDDNRPGTFYTWVVHPKNNLEGDGLTDHTSVEENNQGPISGNVSLQDKSRGGSATFTIRPHIRKSRGGVCDAADTEEVHISDVTAPPVIASIAMTPDSNGSFCSGDDKVEIKFNLSNPNSDAVIAWSNDNSATGLAMGGTGDIGPFKAAINETDRDFVSNILVTPTLNTCVGEQKTASITVKPAPKVKAVPNPAGNDEHSASICKAAPEITLSNPDNIPGTRYLWNVAATNVGKAEDISIPPPSQTDRNPATAPSRFNSSALMATTNQPGTVVYTFSALGSNGCVGIPANPPVTITVNPVPQGIAKVEPSNICPSKQPSVVLQSKTSTKDNSMTIPAKYTWTVTDNVNTQGYSQQSTEQDVTQISDPVILTDKTKPGSLLYNIVPYAYGCTGNVFYAQLNMIEELHPLTAGPSNTDYCEGDNITLTSSSPDNVFYQWYVSADGGNAGTWSMVKNGGLYTGADTKDLTITNVPGRFHNRYFKVKVTDTRCPDSRVDSEQAQISELLSGAAINADKVSPLVGEAIKYSYTGPLDGTAYAWDFGDGWTSKAMNPVHFYYTRGTYQTRLSVTRKSCTRDLYISPVQVKAPDGNDDIFTGDPSKESGVLAWPVPFTDQLNIESQEAMAKIEMHTMQGATVFSKEVSGFKATLTAGGLAPGVYLITVESASGTARLKAVKY